jgi:hypothetical protein
MDPHKLGWAAGFIDGEGCVRVATHRDGYMEIRLTVGQRVREPLDLIQEMFGVGKVYGPYKTGNVYVLNVSGQGLVDMLTQLLPHLIVKRRQAQLALSFYERDQEGRRELSDQLTEAKRPWLRAV